MGGKTAFRFGAFLAVSVMMLAPVTQMRPANAAGKSSNEWIGKFDQDSLESSASCQVIISIESATVTNNFIEIRMINEGSPITLSSRIDRNGEFTKWMQVEFRNNGYESTEFKFTGSRDGDQIEGSFSASGGGTGPAFYFCVGDFYLARKGSAQAIALLTGRPAQPPSARPPAEIKTVAAKKTPSRWSGRIERDNESRNFRCKINFPITDIFVGNGKISISYSDNGEDKRIVADINSRGEFSVWTAIGAETGDGSSSSPSKISGELFKDSLEGSFYSGGASFSRSLSCSGILTASRSAARVVAAPVESKSGAKTEALEREVARLRAEAEERQRLAKIDADRQAEIKAKRQAEIKAKQDAGRRQRLAAIKREQDRIQAIESKNRAAAEKKRLAVIEKERRAKARADAEQKKMQAAKPPVQSDILAELKTLNLVYKAGLMDKAEYNATRRTLLRRKYGNISQPVEIAKAPPPVKKKLELTVPANINFGDYHALIIGIDNYQKLPELKTAIADATAMARILKESYGFEVNLLINPNRNKIIDALDELRARLKFKDNLLIYYAGHGWLDDKADQGYWMPVDAAANRRSAWISNATITDSLKTIEAKHVMVVADSCYSGRLVRGVNIDLATPKYYQKMARLKARVVLTSGGLEPVADNNGSGHSPFTDALLKTLAENKGVIDGNALFNKIRRPVMVNADQTPQYSDVRKAGHEGGDFLFVRRN